MKRFILFGLVLLLLPISCKDPRDYRKTKIGDIEIIIVDGARVKQPQTKALDSL